MAVAAPIPALSHPPPAAGATRHRALGLPVAAAVTHPTVAPGHHPIGPGLVHRRDAVGLAPTRATPAARPAAVRIGLGAQSHGPLRRRVGDRHLPTGGAAATRDLSPDLLHLLVVSLCLGVADGIHLPLRPLHLVEAVIGPFLAHAARQGGMCCEGEAIRGLHLPSGNSFTMASTAKTLG